MLGQSFRSNKTEADGDPATGARIHSRSGRWSSELGNMYDQSLNIVKGIMSYNY